MNYLKLYLRDVINKYKLNTASGARTENNSDSVLVHIQTTALQSCVWYSLGDGFAPHFKKVYN